MNNVANVFHDYNLAFILFILNGSSEKAEILTNLTK